MQNVTMVRVTIGKKESGDKMIKLKDWYFTKHRLIDIDEDCYCAHGVVSGHPRLEDGIDITTSKVEHIKPDAENDRLIMHTYSGNEYELLLADIQIMHFEETSGFLLQFGISALDKEQCKHLAKQAQVRLQDKVSSLLNNNELYLQLMGVFVQKAFFKNHSGEVRELSIKCHSGMFQDSYLICDGKYCEVDFRYFDRFMEIEPYCWSENVEAVRIENVGDTPITCKLKEQIACPIGKITWIQRPPHDGLYLM